MKGEDFSAWLSAISGMNEGRRAEAKTASAVGAEGGACAKKGGKRGRRTDALETTSVERVAAQGCPHCAGREVVGWGRSHGLLRFHCKRCGRTFNALTKTPMAHLRKKEKWLDHARAMIKGKPGQDRAIVRRSSDDGVPLATSASARAGCQQPRSLSGIVEADETLVLEFFKSRWSDLPRKARKRGGKARHGDPLSGQHTRSRRPRPEGRDLRRAPASTRRASIGRALAGIVTQDNLLIGDGGRPIAAFARRAGIPFHAVLAPGKPAPQAPHLHINTVNAHHSRLKPWLARFNGVASKNLPNSLGWRRAPEAWDDRLEPPNWIKGAIGNHTNR
jgi:hypothetical protein